MTGAQAFRPFFIETGEQVGWQSEDGSVVVGLDQLPAGAVVAGAAAQPGPPMPANGALGDLAGLLGPNTAQAARALPPGFEAVPRTASSALPPGFEMVPYTEADIDKKKGAPAGVREMVGGAANKDRLAQLQKYYPDAKPHGDDNFVYTDPKTKRPTLYNPPGFDYGDIPSVGREIASGVGAAVGAAGAVAAAPFTGGASALAGPAGAGLGGMAGGQLYDLIRQQLLGGVDTQGPLERTTGAASEFGTNAIMQGAGDLVSKGIAQVVGPRISRLTGMTPPQIWNMFRGQGINPTAGQVTGNRMFQGLENATEKMPTGAGPMSQVVDRQINTLGQRVEELATDYGTAGGATAGQTATQAGRSLQEGGRTFVQNFQQRAERMYQGLYRTMPRDMPASPANVVGALSRQRNELAAAPELAARLENPQLRGWLDAIQADLSPGGTLPFNVISSFRSRIGRMLSDPQTVSDIPRAELKEVYAALSRDMEAAAQAAGPAALRQFQAANRFYAAGLKRIESVIDKVVQSKTPEQAYRWAMEGSQARGGGGTKLTQLRRSMQGDEWDVVSSYVLKQMGEAVPSKQGAQTIFSPETFLTRWKTLSTEAQDALFKGTRYQGLPEELDSLVKIAATMRDTKYMSNPSGTAGQSMFMAFLKPFVYGGGAGAGAGALGVGGQAQMALAGAAVGTGNALVPYIAAKALTNPTFVRWLVDLGRGVSNNPNSLPAHIARLTAIAKVDPDVKEFAESVYSSLRPEPQPAP